MRLPTPVTAQPVTTTPATPTLAEWLDRLVAEIDRNRIDLHVPGAALAIVPDDEVMLARGFGVADVENSIALRWAATSTSRPARRGVLTSLIA